MYDRVLLPTDGSENTENATAHAIDAAQRYDAELHILYVVDEDIYGVYSGDEFVHESEGAEQTLEELGEKAVMAAAQQAEDANVATATEIRYGIPHEAILNYIDDADIDIAVLGTKQQSGEYRRLLGSVCERVARLADIPVTIVQATDDT